MLDLIDAAAAAVFGTPFSIYLKASKIAQQEKRDFKACDCGAAQAFGLAFQQSGGAIQVGTAC
jgi:hypothetical protein